MRLIGIGLSAFLLAGLTIFLASSEPFGQSLRAAQSFVQGPVLQFEVPMPAGTATQGQTATIRLASPDRPLIMSGLPAYQSASFLVPRDAGAISGYIEIDLTTQVLPGVQAILRLNIDNTRRGEVLLRPGETGRSLRIELTPHDLSRERLTVSFSLQGSTPQTVCTATHGVEAVVEIEPSTAMHLTLQNALSTPQDRIAAWGGQMHLRWPTKNAGLRDSLTAASAGLRAGYPVRFVEDGTEGLTATQARAALFDTAIPVPRPMHITDFYGGAPERNSLFETRRFQRETTWRIGFEAEQTFGARRPETLELAMRLGQHPNGATWQVTIVVDGGLVDQVTPDPQSGRLELSLSFPLRSKADGLSIEITARSAFQPEGHCNDGPILVAQLLPSMRLTQSDQTFDDPLSDLRRAIAMAGPVTLNASHDLRPLTATLAAELLAALQIETMTGLKNGLTQINVLPLGAQIDSVGGAPDDHLWLVTFDTDSAAITATRLTDLPTRRTPSVALLIRLAGVKS